MTNNTIAPFAKPLYVMVKPIGARCNLVCDYCYYFEKHHLYAQTRPMSDALLEHFVKEYIQAQTTDKVLFVWHGGEPLLRPLEFYRKALRLQKRYAGGRQIDNSLQTNGTLLTDEWCEFLKKNNWLVGISFDGTAEMTNRYRHTAAGTPAWAKIMHGLALLKKHGVEWNAMATVNAANVDQPLEFYRFFKEKGCTFLQFAPVVERIIPHDDGRHLAALHDKEGALAPYSVTPEAWGDFLCAIFDEWVRTDVGRYYVEYFDCTLANWVGMAPGICIFNKECGHAGVMEANGDVYSCDHFVFPEYRLGNIHDKSLVEMLYGEQQRAFSRLKHARLPRQCKECPFEFACHGECPKNRFVNDKYGEPGLNYLCAGYLRYFKHVAPYMDFMKRELDNRRAPANVMDAIRRGVFG